MALQMGENVTLGYDSSNMKVAIEKMHTDVFEKIKSEMNANLEELKTAVDEVWVGFSADAFKKNLERDQILLSDNIDAIYNGLVQNINSLMSGMGKADNEAYQAASRSGK